MPTLEMLCENGHEPLTDVQYLRSWEVRAEAFNKTCSWCGGPMWPMPSFGTPLLFFRENKAQYIANLDATIRSHGEHVRVMKARGVEPDLDWHASKKRTDGLKTKAPKPHPKTKVLS